jgi:hypothetical protein
LQQQLKSVPSPGSWSVLSNGTARIGTEQRDPDTLAVLGYGTGVVNQTGGTFSGFSYRMIIGDNSMEGDSSIGHYRLLGGTLGFPAPITQTTESGHIWLGRGSGGTTGTGVGKLTINQAAKCNTTGLLSINDALAGTGTRADASKGETWSLRLSKPSHAIIEDFHVRMEGIPPVLAGSREALLKPAK